LEVPDATSFNIAHAKERAAAIFFIEKALTKLNSNETVKQLLSFPRRRTACRPKSLFTPCFTFRADDRKWDSPFQIISAGSLIEHSQASCASWL
jgi:hypothetical protein